ncbi:MULTISPECIES: molybdate ABC transporter substrate-binding protein [unclassified Psychrobacter]|jgi:molybdate transport system substrate-binding protein|uniref:molybdate ABC transporter substrate-binding protein n=1 Tax=unclassified Psychrobacter TaxID=196806 RepID=UPI00086B1098|nr:MULTISPECIES: molybdate ABC transporter substrate-binding protein [unclassified Psychrobacter]MBA6245151.1 molybdate ABC transporter substrate-binding protein [Psychrobacter sp. Urea-trap-18]MBA6286754.1 molybdate ABC transporter substrate-binding protein [Psychrobacter sp. Urea-trap-16]MBA6317787.1 molybdate ABC transporter substrate-binding protein [Psychrobacter sp. Urea-trap-20]MBA6334478.1 molybdate ABC transporter substrate-binding protein [Psychrobacter sp. Urea-trap-19]OEH68493.1 MA|tara:strand:+ start:463 stop:1338 length:876 start_codon:yes stop_codon:yes gene_type:complete
MVKSLVAVCVSACLLLSLSACTQDKDANTMLAGDTTEPARTLRIAAAANLSDVLPHIIDSYQADNSSSAQNVSSISDIEVTYASSGKLYAQIKAGAPYDIFLSANQAFPAKLADENLVSVINEDNKLTKPFTYTRGQLALYSVTKPLNDFTPTSLGDVFTSADFTQDSKVAIANPNLAPYGASAKAYLQSQNTYDKLNAQKSLIQSENIGQAFQYAHTGSVDYGFVAQSQLVAIKAKPEQFITLLPASYPAILQDGIIINNNTVSAADFTDYLRSKAGQQHFLQAGYLAVQ